MKKVYHSDEIPQFNWSAAYALCIETSIQAKLSFPDSKPIFKNHAYFSVTSIALNDVNLRGGNVIKPSHEKSVRVINWHCFSR